MIMASLNDYQPGDTANAIHASPVHAAAICRLIAYWADQGLTIRRDLRSVVQSIDDFSVAMYHQRVVGCGAIQNIAQSGGTLAEIRSIAVDPGAKKVKAGRAVMDALMAKAQARGIEQVVLLTKTPGFFEKFGFTAIEEGQVPQAYEQMIAVEPGRTRIGKVAMQRLTTARSLDVTVTHAGQSVLSGLDQVIPGS